MALRHLSQYTISAFSWFSRHHFFFESHKTKNVADFPVYINEINETIPGAMRVTKINSEPISYAVYVKQNIYDLLDIVALIMFEFLAIEHF